METFAVIDIESNIVVNKILAENKELAEQVVNEETPDKYICIQYTDPSIGDSWNGTDFIKSE
jgi:hypothetical protein